MLAAEEMQRTSLDDLLKKSMAVGRHLELDKRLSDLSARGTALTQAFQTSFVAYQNALNEVMVLRLQRLLDSTPALVPPPDAERLLVSQADRSLTATEDALNAMADVYVEMTGALLARADLRLGGITRPELEAAIGDIAERADIIDDGLARNREFMDEVLAAHRAPDAT